MRGARRAELQQQIDDALARFEALEVQTPTPPPVAESVEEVSDTAQAVEPAEPLISEEELASLRAEKESLAQTNRSLVSDNDLLKAAGQPAGPASLARAAT